MNLPRPTPQYDTENETQARNEIAAADKLNIKKGSVQTGFIMQSPDGSRFTASVTNAGAWLLTPL